MRLTFEPALRPRSTPLARYVYRPGTARATKPLPRWPLSGSEYKFRCRIEPAMLRRSCRHQCSSIHRGQDKLKKLLYFTTLSLFVTLCAFAQTASTPARITGVVKDPNQAVLPGIQVVLTNVQTKVKLTAVTNSQGDYSFSAMGAGTYVVEIDAKGFKPSASSRLTVAAGQAINSDFVLALAGNTESVTVSAGSVENAYRVDTVMPGSPLGLTPIVNLPYSINVISRQLIDDTMSRNFKEAAKYLPLVEFQEMQGPEVLRPETRGMQGSNMQND